MKVILEVPDIGTSDEIVMVFLLRRGGILEGSGG